MSESDLKRDENTIKFLMNASAILPNNGRPYSFMKSEMLTRCLSKSEHRFRFPPKYIAPETRCGKCFLEWKQDNFSFKFSETKKLKKKQRRKYKVIAENRNGFRSEKEISKAKSKLQRKELMIECSFCGSTTKCSMTNKASNSRNSNESTCISSTPRNALNITKSIGNNNTPTNKSQPRNKNKTLTKVQNTELKQKLYENLTTPNRKVKNNDSTVSVRTPTPAVSDKKKRKRDRFAGLIKQACVSSTPTSTQNSPLMKFLKQNVN